MFVLLTLILCSNRRMIPLVRVLSVETGICYTIGVLQLVFLRLEVLLKFPSAVSKSPPVSSKVSNISCTFAPAQCRSSFSCFIFNVYRYKIVLKSFLVFLEPHARHRWFPVWVKWWEIDACFCRHIMLSVCPLYPRRHCSVFRSLLYTIEVH